MTGFVNILLVALLAVLTLSGCSAPFKPGGKSKGEEIFEAKRCISCHTVNNNAGRAGLIDLSKEGDKRPAGYLDKWLADPKSVDKKAKMPKPSLSDEERSALVDFLVSLR
ncbi:MAG: cytochrome c [Actinobacteria bacterium]|nr:cytochrome c [Actinomycetota bacterium]